MANYITASRDRLRGFLNDAVGNSAFWDGNEKIDAINEAISLWQAYTGEWTFPFTISVTSGQVYYPVPRQIVATQRLSYNSTPLTLTSLYELDFGFPGWETTAAGTPQLWAPSGLTEVAIYPPALSGTLLFNGIQESPRLLSGGDTLNLGEEELRPMLDYAQHYLAFKEGSVELQSTLSLMKKFIGAAGLRNSRLQASSAYRKLMGEVREEAQRLPRAPEGSLGVR